MPPITKENLELIIALQATETEAAEIEAILDGLPAQSAALERELDEITRLVESRKNHAAELKKKYRSLEADFDKYQERIKKRRTQLDAVKSNKDYQALLKEIEDIKTASSLLEDEMLQCLDDIEKADAGLAEAGKRYDEKKAEIDGKNREIEEYGALQQEKLAQLRARALDLAGKLDPKLKKQYYIIKDKSGGVAIVSVNDAICKGCHLNIPPQLFNELHKENELRLCPHCYRMIYVLL